MENQGDQPASTTAVLVEDVSPPDHEPTNESPVSIPSEPTDQLPPSSLITDWESFTEADEYYEAEPVDGEMIFSYTVLLILDPSSGTAYFGCVETRLRDLSMEQARSSLHRIPDDEIYPLLPADWAALGTDTIGPQHYTKRPRFASYSWAKGTQVTAERFLEEGRMLLLTRQHPHRNLLQLEACLVRNGRVQGLLIKRYPTNLKDRVKDKKGQPLDNLACFEGIVAGVRHLHALGVAHNDINPKNILLDAEDHPVIADFGGCKRFGEALTELGTPGWNEGFDEEVATPKNDQIGLRKVGEWLGIEGKILEELLQHDGIAQVDAPAQLTSPADCAVDVE